MATIVACNMDTYMHSLATCTDAHTYVRAYVVMYVHLFIAPDPSATFHIFCLLKLRHEVMDTSSIVEITRDSRDVVFDSLVQL